MSHNKVFNLQAVTVCVTQHSLKFVVVTIFLCHTTLLEIHWHSGKLNTIIIIIIYRQTTHLQLGQDFEFVTSHSVLATVSVSGHSEIAVRKVFSQNPSSKNQLVVTFP